MAMAIMRRDARHRMRQAAECAMGCGYMLLFGCIVRNDFVGVIASGTTDLFSGTYGGSGKKKFILPIWD